MNIKRMSVLLLLLIAVAATTSPLYAQNQNTGFQIGLAPPQNPLATPSSPNPVQGMTTPPIQGMTTPPIMPMGGVISPQQPVVTPQFLTGFGNQAIAVLPPGGTIFVPAGTLVIQNNPGQQPGAFLSAPLSPVSTNVPAAPSVGSRGGGSAGQRANRPVNTGNAASSSQPSSTKQDVSRLDLGTPQDKVIEKYGNPVAFIQGMNGETLYFNGGVVVFVKNGVVATPVN